MGAVSKIKMALGAVDGVNTDFSTPTPYHAGTLKVWVTGRMISEFTEVDPTAGTFSIAFAPKPGGWVATAHRGA